MLEAFSDTVIRPLGALAVLLAACGESAGRELDELPSGQWLRGQAHGEPRFLATVDVGGQSFALHGEARMETDGVPPDPIWVGDLHQKALFYGCGGMSFSAWIVIEPVEGSRLAEHRVDIDLSFRTARDAQPLWWRHVGRYRLTGDRVISGEGFRLSLRPRPK